MGYVVEQLKLHGPRGRGWELHVDGVEARKFPLKVRIEILQCSRKGWMKPHQCTTFPCSRDLFDCNGIPIWQLQIIKMRKIELNELNGSNLNDVEFGAEEWNKFSLFRWIVNEIGEHPFWPGRTSTDEFGGHKIELRITTLESLSKWRMVSKQIGSSSSNHCLSGYLVPSWRLNHSKKRKIKYVWVGNNWTIGLTSSIPNTSASLERKRLWFERSRQNLLLLFRVNSSERSLIGLSVVLIDSAAEVKFRRGARKDPGTWGRSMLSQFPTRGRADCWNGRRERFADIRCKYINQDQRTSAWSEDFSSSNSSKRPDPPASLSSACSSCLVFPRSRESKHFNNGVILPQGWAQRQ